MSDIIKIGVIGTGSISNFHMIGYNAIPDKAKVVACCDLNLERAKEWAKKYGIDESQVYGSYDEMLAKADIDAVSVTAWNNAHAPASIAAMKAGKHVLCEKPLALNSELGLEMQKVSKETGKLLMVGFVRRFGQNVRIFNNFLNNDRIGQINYIKTSCIRRVGNPCGWFSDKKRSGGGPLIDVGVHMIDLSRFLMGNPKPVAVSGATFNNIGTRLNIKDYPRYEPADKDDYNDVEDMAVAMIRFDNGAILQVEVSFSQHIKQDELTLTVYGTKGGIQVEPSMEIYTEMDDYLADIKPVYAVDNDPFGNNFRNEIAHFVDCIQNGTPCQNPVEDGVAIMKILDAVYESAKLGREVEIKW